MSRRTPILAALLLALWPLGLRAAVVGEVRLYSAPSEAWSGAIGGALTTVTGAPALAPSLAPLTAPGLAPGAAYAPVVAQLQSGLALTPKAFAALPLNERHAALELAVDAAESDLRHRIYALTDQAQTLAAPGKNLDKDGRAGLYRVVAQLQEIRTQYGPLVPADARQSLDDSFARAAVRALEVRSALMNGRARRMAAELGEDDGAETAAAPARGPLPAPSEGARDLAADMRNNPIGWKLRDLDHLLIGYGFTLKQGGSHRKYEFPGMKPEIVPRHTEVDPNYIRSALAAIDLIEERRAEGASVPRRDAEAAAPPSYVDLAALSVLVGAETSKPKAPRPRPAETGPAAVAPVETPTRPLPAAARLAPSTPRAAPEPQAEPAAPAPVSEPDAPTLRDRLRGLWSNLLGPR
jgi:hypothetical protein